MLCVESGCQKETLPAQ